MKIGAREKFGFRHTEAGKLDIFKEEAAYAYRLGVSDQLKFRENRASYQEIIFELCGLEFQGEDYLLAVPEDCRVKAAGRLEKSGRGRRIALNLGSGPVFANKSWPAEAFVRLIHRLAGDGETPVVVAGPRERALYDRVMAEAGDAAFPGGCDNSLQEFAALLEACDAAVTGDTMALHIALACKTRVVGIFGPTCPQEIHLYGRGELLITPKACAPCYRGECDIHPSCMEEISVEEVYRALQRQLSA
jgi:heptosyltransferase-2